MRAAPSASWVARFARPSLPFGARLGRRAVVLARHRRAAYRPCGGLGVVVARVARDRAALSRRCVVRVGGGETTTLASFGRLWTAAATGSGPSLRDRAARAVSARARFGAVVRRLDSSVEARAALVRERLLDRYCCPSELLSVTTRAAHGRGAAATTADITRSSRLSTSARTRSAAAASRRRERRAPRPIGCRTGRAARAVLSGPNGAARGSPLPGLPSRARTHRMRLGGAWPCRLSARVRASGCRYVRVGHGRRFLLLITTGLLPASSAR